jgi:hypothetical protein
VTDSLPSSTWRATSASSSERSWPLLEVRHLFDRESVQGAEWRVLERVFELVRRKIEPEYENPWDAALAAYLLFLMSGDVALASVAADAVLECPNCWWSRKVAEIKEAFHQFGSSAHNIYEWTSGARTVSAKSAVTGQSRFAGIGSGSLPPQVQLPWLVRGQQQDLFKNQEAKTHTVVLSEWGIT